MNANDLVTVNNVNNFIILTISESINLYEIIFIQNNYFDTNKGESYQKFGTLVSNFVDARFIVW